VADQHVTAAIRKSPLIERPLRRDIPEYPQVALREAIVNAVAHRDYSPYVRGTPIDIKIFADRLAGRSPDGLNSNVTWENIESSKKAEQFSVHLPV
jgi:ATP-dependent DNA helicase RecG